MLGESKAHATLPVIDLERARRFYGETLGLETEFETPSGIMFAAGGGTRLLAFPSMSPDRGGHTQAGWAVDDIAAEVATLRQRGVTFEEYDYPTLKTVDGIAEVPAGQAAWFKDTEGNLLGLVQLGD